MCVAISRRGVALALFGCDVFPARPPLDRFQPCLQLSHPLLRVSGVISIQAPISSRVRPHPKQKPVFMSIEQTRMHGDSMAVMSFS
jgi:hypothetical protein